MLVKYRRERKRDALIIDISRVQVHRQMRFRRLRESRRRERTCDHSRLRLLIPTPTQIALLVANIRRYGARRLSLMYTGSSNPAKGIHGRIFEGAEVRARPWVSCYLGGVPLVWHWKQIFCQRCVSCFAKPKLPPLIDIPFADVARS